MIKAKYFLRSWIAALGFSVLSCAPQAGGLVSSPRGETDITVDQQVYPDQEIKAMIAPYKARLDAEMNEVIGQVGTELFGRAEGESPLANFVADLTRAVIADSTGLPIDLGVTNTGGLRVPLAVGSVQLSDVYELMPFDNTLVVLRLSGAQMQQLYARAAQQGNIVFSGNSKLVVEDGQLATALIDGERIDPAASYLVATSSYLAEGGDNVTVFKQAETVEKTNILLRDAIAATFRSLQEQGQAAEAYVDGRYVNPALLKD